MLWRSRYEPKILRDVKLPEPLPDGIVLAAFDPKGLGEVSLWLRLVDSAGLLEKTQVIVFGDPQELPRIKLLLPKSLHHRLEVRNDVEGKWARLIEPDTEARAFSLVSRRGMAELIVTGPPTEEVWEEFERVAISL